MLEVVWVGFIFMRALFTLPLTPGPLLDMLPSSTTNGLSYAEQVMGRRMARCVIEKAGLACFWDSQYHPPRDVLERASEYVATLADVMKEEGIHGVIDLLQGETIATVLKNIGKTVAKQPQLEQVAAGSDAVDAQQQQQQGTSAAGAEGGTLWAEKLQGLRSLVVLMHLLEEHIGSHAFQVGCCKTVTQPIHSPCSHAGRRWCAKPTWVC